MSWATVWGSCVWGSRVWGSRVYGSRACVSWDSQVAACSGRVGRREMGHGCPGAPSSPHCCPVPASCGPAQVIHMTPDRLLSLRCIRPISAFTALGRWVARRFTVVEARVCFLGSPWSRPGAEEISALWRGEAAGCGADTFHRPFLSCAAGRIPALSLLGPCSLPVQAESSLT